MRGDKIVCNLDCFNASMKLHKVDSRCNERAAKWKSQLKSECYPQEILSKARRKGKSVPKRSLQQDKTYTRV